MQNTNFIVNETILQIVTVQNMYFFLLIKRDSIEPEN